MDGTELPDFDELRTALRTDPRRQVLHELMSRNAPARARDRVADDDGGPRPGSPAAAVGRPVTLPKLEKYGYVEWDPTAGAFRRGPNFDEVERLLEL